MTQTVEQRIARMEPAELVANADEIIAAASTTLSKLTRGGQFRMSIPVQDDDSDIALGAAIRLARALLEQLDQRDAAIRWALGEEGDFSETPEPLREIIAAGVTTVTKGDSAVGRRPIPRLYWWRGELRNRAFGSAAALPREEDTNA